MVANLVSLELDSLTLGQAYRVHSLAERFEAEYASNNRPSVVSYLAELDDAHARLVLFHELTKLERALNQDDARYRNRQHHRDGNFGRVWVAHDEPFGRKVAYKEPRDDRADDPESLARFLNEARITGRLQHPGIAPVYSLGFDAQDRPYYAMRFIDGQSLTEAIRRFHEADTNPQRDPGERNVSFRGLLSRFVSVCDTMAYAHGQGVIHRDLKPENIMLGDFGEAIVTDWGLAKEHWGIDTADCATENGALFASISRPTSHNAVHETRVDTIIGTPAYMSPEQAAGAISTQGPTSDIYGLGTTLYHLLTGRAPFDGAISNQVLSDVKRGKFLPPRQVNSQVPKPLEAVCLKAMALKPDDRYVSAHVLAEDIKDWLADEPVSAWREPMALQAQRWARRQRTAVAAAAAALIVGLAAMCVGYWRVSTLNNRLAERNQQLRLAKIETDNRLDQTLRAIEDYHTGVGQDLLLGQKEFQDLRGRLLEKPKQFYEQLTRELESAVDERGQSLLAKGRFGLGRIMGLLGETEEAVRQEKATVAIYDKLAEAHPEVAEHQIHLAACYANLALIQNKKGDIKEAADSFRAAIEVATRFLLLNPNDLRCQDVLGWSYNGLCLVQRDTGDLGGATESCRHVISIYSNCMATQPNVLAHQASLALGYTNLGGVQRAAGDLEGAAESYLKAIAGWNKLEDAKPNDPSYGSGLAWCLLNLGCVQNDSGDHQQADQSIRRAIAQWLNVLKTQSNIMDYQDGLARAYNALGSVQHDTGNHEASAQSQQRAIDIWSKLGAPQSNVPGHQRGIADSYLQLGVAQRSTGGRRSAEQSIRKAIDVFSIVLAAHPELPGVLEDLASCHANLGIVQIENGDFVGAAESHSNALALRARLVAEAPDVPTHRAALARSHLDLGAAQRAEGVHSDAAESYLQAIATWRSLVKVQPDVPSHQRGLATSYVRLSEVQRDMGDPESAAESSHDAVLVEIELTRAHPDSPEDQSLLGLAYESLGAALANQRNHSEAEQCYRRSVEQQQSALEGSSENSLFRERLSSHYAGLASTLRAQSRARDAATVARTRMALWKSSAAEIYRAACELALCVPIAEDNTVRESLGAEAAETLRRAIDVGWYDAVQTSRDPDLAPLGARHDFRLIVAKLFDRIFPADPFRP